PSVAARNYTHHGLTKAVIMPYALRFKRRVLEYRIKRLSAYVGLKPSFRAFLDWVLALRAEIGVPHTLAGLNVGDDRIDRVVAMAGQDPTAAGNPLPLGKRAPRTVLRPAPDGRPYGGLRRPPPPLWPATSP